MVRRWLSDLGGDLNPYAYVHGTPLMGVDPDGNYAGYDDLAAFGVGFITSVVSQYVQNGKVDWSDAFVDGVAAWATLYAGPYGAPAVSAGSYALKQGLNGDKVTSAGIRDAAVSGAVSGAVSSKLPGTGSALADGVYKGAASGTASYVATSSFHGGPTWKGVGNAAKNGATGGGIGYGVGTAVGTNKEQAQKSEGPDGALPRYDGEGGQSGQDRTGGKRGAGSDAQLPGRFDAGSLVDRTLDGSGQYVLSTEGHARLDRIFKQFGYHTSKATIEFTDGGPIGETDGNHIYINRNTWESLNDTYQARLLAHELTHAAQFQQAGYWAIRVRTGLEKVEHWIPDDNYDISNKLMDTPLSRLNLIDSRYTLESIAERVAISVLLPRKP